jgi:uncharacterized protein YukE
MQEKNKINFDQVKKMLNQVEEISTTASTSLMNIDKIINETVNSGLGIWDGTSACEFKERWTNISSEIPTLIKYLQSQTNNLKIMLEKAKNIE